ncbi:MAG: FHA domain-containing protein [Gemmatimonadaceae bacterium]|nr:FHA domain-containing protein [Gemmatimonadaceae bacterium]
MPVLETGGTIRELNDGETVVGSGANATWRLGGADLAARHFTVALGDDGQATVKSCSTQNVVLVNGRQLGVRPLPLADGDTIAAGTARFVYAKDASSLRPATNADNSPAYLVDERARMAFPLARRSVSIGRDAGSIVVVRDPQVSRFHADVRTEAGAHVLYSMGSAGTLVNGHGVAAPRVLESGDKIEIGQTTLLFVRGNLPPGVKVSQGPVPAEEDWSRRPTVSAGVIDTGEGPRVRRGIPWGIIVVAIIVIAAVAYFVMR